MRGGVVSRMAAAAMMAVFASSGQAAQWTYLGAADVRAGCAARLVGKDVDTMLMLGRNGELVLVAGKSDWRVSGPEKIGLRIDHGAMDHLTATAFRNLILVHVGNKAFLQELETAKVLYWYFPWGAYHAEVAGLGNAVKWLQGCQRAKQSQSANYSKNGR
jgi:hypothetical protein